MRELHLYVRGAIDLATAPKVRRDFLDSVAPRRDHVELDCSDMTFIDSTGIRLLVEMHATLHAQGRRLRVTHLAPTSARAIHVLGLGSMLRIDEIPTDEVPVVG